MPQRCCLKISGKCTRRCRSSSGKSQHNDEVHLDDSVAQDYHRYDIYEAATDTILLYTGI